MHETSLIDYALNAVEAKAAQLGITEVSEVGLIVGEAKAVRMSGAGEKGQESPPSLLLG